MAADMATLQKVRKINDNLPSESAILFNVHKIQAYFTLIAPGLIWHVVSVVGFQTKYPNRKLWS